MTNELNIDVEKFEKLLSFKYENKELKKENEVLKKTISDLKNVLLDASVKGYEMKACKLTELTEISGGQFGLAHVNDLLRFCSVRELTGFIEKKYKALHETEVSEDE